MTRQWIKLISWAGALLFSGFAGASDWPQWRGEKGEGVYTGEEWQISALQSPKTLWTAQVGDGYSAVTVFEGRLYTMGYQGAENVILCLESATGKELWNFRYAANSGGGYKGPRSTPVVDVKSGNVLALGQGGELHALDGKSGRPVWTANLVKEQGAGNLKWMFAASPRILGEAVIVNAGRAGMAFDRVTGKKLWSNGGGVGGYATPVVLPLEGGARIGLFGEKDFSLLDPATGKIFWSYPWQTKHDVNAADPVLAGKNIFITSGYGTGGAMLSPEGKELWKTTAIASHMASPVFLDGHLYGTQGNTGNIKLVCLEAGSGKLAWEANNGTEAMLVAGKTLILITKNGELLLAAASKEKYQELSRTKIFAKGGVQYWTAPVLAEGRLYCRDSKGHLICFKAD